MQMGNLERQLLWATIDASRRRSQRAAQPSGKLAISALASLVKSILLLCRFNDLCGVLGFLFTNRPTTYAGGSGGSGSLQTLRGVPADGSGTSGMASFLSESGTPDWVSEFRLVLQPET